MSNPPASEFRNSETRLSLPACQGLARQAGESNGGQAKSKVIFSSVFSCYFAEAILGEDNILSLFCQAGYGKYF
jgi:hypothetical protein